MQRMVAVMDEMAAILYVDSVGMHEWMAEERTIRLTKQFQADVELVGQIYLEASGRPEMLAIGFIFTIAQGLIDALKEMDTQEQG